MYKLITHTDLDGVSCAILARIAWDNNVDVTSQFVQQQLSAESYSVNNVGSYGFTLNNSTGYYTSNNFSHTYFFLNNHEWLSLKPHRFFHELP